MPIQVKLKGTTVTINPMTFDATGQGNQTLEWKPHDNSDAFDFDSPAITFDDPQAPISGITASGDEASATDSVSASGEYSYHVHLIDAQGNHITYPPPDSGTDATMKASKRNNPAATGGVSAMGAMTGTDPTIKNRPN